jgi:hypothetical protein
MVITLHLPALASGLQTHQQKYHKELGRSLQEFAMDKKLNNQF